MNDLTIGNRNRKRCWTGINLIYCWPFFLFHVSSFCILFFLSQLGFSFLCDLINRKENFFFHLRSIRKPIPNEKKREREREREKVSLVNNRIQITICCFLPFLHWWWLWWKANNLYLPLAIIRRPIWWLRWWWSSNEN